MHAGDGSTCVCERSTLQSVVDFLLEQNGMTHAGLAPLLGGRTRVSDFFNGRRSLSIGQIQTLRERFGVSADVLLPDEPSRAHGQAHGQDGEAAHVTVRTSDGAPTPLATIILITRRAPVCGPRQPGPGAQHPRVDLDE